MKLIKNGCVQPLEWQFAEEFDFSGSKVSQIITFDALFNISMGQIAKAKTGVRIVSDNQLDELVPYLSELDLIVVEFSSFADGRGFSIAYRLRHSLGYQGEIWGMGNLIADQYAYAMQCGIDGVLIDDIHLKRQPVEQWQEALNDAPLTYRYHDEIGQPVQMAKKNPIHQIGNNGAIENEVARLNDRFSDRPTEELLNFILHNKSIGKVALVSSFGAQSSVLLHLVAKVAPRTDVLFIDTGKLFQQTLEFQKKLASALELANVTVVKPDISEISKRDAKGDLWQKDNSACCDFRKIVPLSNELEKFDAWISGRKKFQGGIRESLKLFENSDGRIKINPLADWSQDQIEAYITRYKLPMHPLVAEGYSSIGCAPCTSPDSENEPARAGRWRGTEKTECGIHFIAGDLTENNAEIQQQAG